MAFHTVAYGLPQATIGTYPQYTEMSVLADPSIAVVNENWVPSETMMLGAAFVSAPKLINGRISTPTSRVVSPMNVRPVNNDSTMSSPGGFNLMNIMSNPMQLRTEEEVFIELEVTEVTAAGHAFALLWAYKQLEAVPAGESFWITFESTDAALAPGWVPINVKYETKLPTGVYAVIGFEFVSGSVTAARLVFDGQVERPGTLPVGFDGARAPWPFYDGSFGVFGKFKAFAPPRVEILPVGTPPPSPSHRGALRVIKIG